MFLLPYLTYFVIFPADMLLGGHTLIENQDLHLQRVMLLLLLGLLAFVTGFFAALRRSRRWPSASWLPSYAAGATIPADISTRRAFLVTVFSGAVTLALCLLLIFRAGGFQHILANYSVVYSEFFTKQNYLIAVTIGFAIVNLSSHLGLVARRRRGGWLFLLNLAAVLLLMFFQGSRSSLIVLLLVVLVLYHIYIRRIKPIRMFYIAAIIISFFVGAFLFRDFSEVPSSILEVIYKAFIVVNDEMTQVLTLVDGMPEHLEFQYGRTFLHLFLMPIPRFLWPEKPAAISIVIKDIFFPQYWKLGLSWPPSIIGELYANFQGIGIPVGMFLFGYLAGRLQRFTLKRMDFYGTTIYGATLFLVFREVRGDFATVTSIYLMQIAIFAVVGRLAFQRRRKSVYV